MRTRKIKALTAAGLLALGGAAQAALVVQSHNFNLQAGPSDTTPLDIPLGSLTATFLPFDASLGELTSFTLVWDLIVSASLTVTASTSYVSVSGPEGTSALSVGGFGYSGMGGSGTKTGSLGETLTATFNAFNTKVFPIPPNYDANILATVTGASPYAVLWDRNVEAKSDPGEFSDLRSGVTGSVTMTYEYTPAPAQAPLPGSLLLLLPGLGLLGLRARRAGRQADEGGR